MEDIIKFGDPKNYYSHKKKQREAGESKSEKLLTEALLTFNFDLENEVKRAVRKWNQLIREQLRNETGLRFQVGSTRDNIPIKVSDGYPPDFKKIIDNIKFPELWELIVNRKLLEDSKQGLSLVLKHYKSISNIVSSVPSEKIIKDAQKFIEEIISVISEKELDNKIKGLTTDILGAYFFLRPEIEIYWQVIGFYALRFDISVDYLTAVVLTHELAHAFTHLGKDIDKVRWDTTKFANTDTYIIEGLAQFYTEMVSKNLYDRSPELYHAYLRLLLYQDGPYIAHKEWLNNKTRIGEVIRLALIQIRMDAAIDNEAFTANLDKVRKQVMNEKKQEQNELFDEE
jgi:hypothetical protein